MKESFWGIFVITVGGSPPIKSNVTTFVLEFSVIFVIGLFAFWFPYVRILGAVVSLNSVLLPVPGKVLLAAFIDP